MRQPILACGLISAASTANRLENAASLERPESASRGAGRDTCKDRDGSHGEVDAIPASLLEGERHDGIEQHPAVARGVAVDPRRGEPLQLDAQFRPLRPAGATDDVAGQAGQVGVRDLAGALAAGIADRREHHNYVALVAALGS